MVETAREKSFISLARQMSGKALLVLLVRRGAAFFRSESAAISASRLHQIIHYLFLIQ